MCGIVGIVNHLGLAHVERDSLPRLANLLRHRGPDEAGHYLDSHAALGHRRLSIIDLETGRQPLQNENGTIRAVVNGEIYNFHDLRDQLIGLGHTFRTASDSECVVHAYESFGERCVERLDGMFAIAVWDAPRRTLLLARDRLGEKPLYFYVDDRRILFASELKPILAAPGVPREMSVDALLDFLTYGFIPSPGTIFRDIRKLSPGEMLVWRDGRAVVKTYWDLHHRGWTAQTINEAASDVWHSLKRATRARLVADVPVGAFLSGGVDSGAVLGAMSQLSRKPVTALTCGFDERGFDEREAAGETARLLGADHRVEHVQPDAADVVDRLAWHFDEPFADASAIPLYYLSRHARRFVKVALSGDGGDEVLAGYRRYRFDCREEAIRARLPAGLRRLCGGLARRYPQSARLPRPLRARRTLENLASDPATAHARSIATLPPHEALRLVQPDLLGPAACHDPLERARLLYLRCDAPDHLSKCQYVDIKLGLGDGILTKVDRASMAHGLEVRAPMLDHHFVEAAWRIAPRLRWRGRQGKLPLRHAVARQLNQRLAERAKTGFEVPLDAWFRGPLRERFEDRLLSPGAQLHDWICPGAIRNLWKRHQGGHANGGAIAWRLLMLDAWAGEILGGTRQIYTPATRAVCIPGS